MKFVYFLILSAFAVATMAQDTYTTAYDNVNIEMILRSDRLFKTYLACILDEGPCSADAKTFKNVLPEALETNCAKCSEKQREMVKTIGRYMTVERPDAWERVSKKYDPKGLHRQSFLNFIKS